MPMEFWKVTLNGKEIDSVPYVEGMTPAEVKMSLINHDGYNPGIEVESEITGKRSDDLDTEHS